MTHREMTPDERRRFEKETLHHEHEAGEGSLPASEQEVRRDRDDVRAPGDEPAPPAGG